MKLNEWPERDELVVIRIKRISDYGANAELIEYAKKEGFIHISRVSSAWVKNIRSVISEGQVRVAKVRFVDKLKNLIDLSLRDVSEQQEKRKNEDYKREKKADKLLERITKEIKEDFKKTYPEIVTPLIDEFGDLFAAFENANVYGEECLKDVNIPAKWKKAIAKEAEKSISTQKVEISGNLSLTSNASDGVDVIKNSLLQIKDDDVKIEYVSAPNYKIKVKAIDYENAEKKLKKIVDSILNDIKKTKGEGSFERQKS